MGLAKKRHCAFLPDSEPEQERPVWVRKEIAVTRCPKSLITAQSLAWLELFQAWKLGGLSLYDLSAKDWDAIVTLEELLIRERSCTDERD